MLHLLEHIPFLGHAIVAPLLSTLHGAVNVVQAIVGI